MTELMKKETVMDIVRNDGYVRIGIVILDAFDDGFYEVLFSNGERVPFEDLEEAVEVFLNDPWLK